MAKDFKRANTMRKVKVTWTEIQHGTRIAKQAFVAVPKAERFGKALLDNRKASMVMIHY